MAIERTNTGLTMTDDERDLLAVCEETIAAGLNTFMEVGQALATIRNKKLYHKGYGGEYANFESYCREKWSISRQRAHQLIEATEIVDDLSTLVDKPTSETHIRPLAALPPEQRAEAWKEATETAPGGKVTAAHVQSVVDRRTGKGDTETTTEYVDLDTGAVIDNVEVVKTTTHRPTREDLMRSSDAMNLAAVAISQLKRIRSEDPLRADALESVSDWIESNR